MRVHGESTGEDEVAGVGRAVLSMGHSRALKASLAPLLRDRNRPSVETDLAPLNLGLTTAYRGAQNPRTWRTLIGTATFDVGHTT